MDADQFYDHWKNSYERRATASTAIAVLRERNAGDISGAKVSDRLDWENFQTLLGTYGRNTSK